MRGEDRRKIAELVTWYSLEPHLFDVYVEGSTDASIIRWFLSSLGCSSFKVYEIDGIDVPAELVSNAHPGEAGHRGRVITLASELARSLGDSLSYVHCIADSDADFVLQMRFDSPYLAYTDYADVEMYLYRDEVIEKFLRLCLRNQTVESELLLDQFAVVLKESFLIRTAIRILGLGVPSLSIDRCCATRGARIAFDSEEYLRRRLNVRGESEQVVAVLSTVEELRPRLLGDRRRYLNGHDFLELLSWYVRQVLRQSGPYQPLQLVRVLSTCLEMSYLLEEPLFRSLRASAARFQ